MAQVMMYKSPGPYAQYGNTMMNLAVEDEQIDMAKAEGWFLTEAEAKKAQADAEANILQAKPTVDAPKSREDLESEAEALSIKFDGRTTDAKLQEKIDAVNAEAKE